MKRKKGISLLLAAAMLASSLMACGSSQTAGTDASAAAGTTEGTAAETTGAGETAAGTAAGTAAAGGAATAVSADYLKVALPSECETMDPGQCCYILSGSVMKALFTGLYKTDETGGKLTNGCAESYDLSADGLTYTFHLYDGLKWSDGSPVTAGDFEYAWKRVLDPATASGACDAFYVIKNGEEYNEGKCTADDVGIKASDDKTLVVTLNAPTPYFLDITAEACYFPVCKSVVSQNDKWSQSADTYVSNGAFKLTEVAPQQDYVLVKNDNYRDAAKVSIPGIEMVFIEDSSSALTAFKNGEVDLTTNISQQAQSEFAGTDTLKEFPTIGLQYYDINCDNITDARVRLALSMDVDRDTINKSIVSSRPDSAFGIVPEGISYSDSGKAFRDVAGNPIEYSPEKAKALVDEAVAAGFDASKEYTFICKNDSEVMTIVQAIQAMWKKDLGLNFKITTYESGSYWDQFYAGNFDVAADSWTCDYDDPNSILEVFKVKNMADQNRWKGDNAEKYNKMIEDAAASTDQDFRFKTFEDAEKLLVQESPIIPMYYKKSQVLVSDRVTNYVSDHLGHNLFEYTKIG